MPDIIDKNAMEKTAKTASTTTIMAKKAGKESSKKSTGGGTIDLKPPLGKKQHAAARCYLINLSQRYTVNPYAHRTRNQMKVDLHKSILSKEAQPQYTLLLGGRTLSIQWKADKRLFSEMQALTQGITRDSSHFMGYRDTIQLMACAGINPKDDFHREAPQIIDLEVECTEVPKVHHLWVPTKEVIKWKGKKHIPFNFMCVCTLNVANDRHGLMAQPWRGENCGLGLQESQNSMASDCGGCRIREPKARGRGRGGGKEMWRSNIRHQQRVEDSNSEEDSNKVVGLGSYWLYV
jgi:hypothetical protein